MRRARSSGVNECRRSGRGGSGPRRCGAILPLPVRVVVTTIVLFLSAYAIVSLSSTRRARAGRRDDDSLRARVDRLDQVSVGALIHHEHVHAR
jgi:hypothetical protein